MNLISILNAYESLNETLFSKYLNNFGVSGLRVHEINSLKKLVQNLTKYILKEDGDDVVDIRTLDGYYVGYNIPQIGKEFDLLKFANGNVVNIELKKEGNKEKILKQLSRNRYYLSFLDKDIFCFTYVSDENKIYKLICDDRTDSLVEIDFSTFYNILCDIEAEHLTNIDHLFDPSNYLVSPFNSTEKFVASEYFLTRQQEDIKKDIVSWIGTKGDNFISLTGSAGTGKTLLIYDIAKELLQNEYRVLIIHCGNLNQGQIQLNTDFDWDIQRVKNGHARNFEEFDLIIVDEVQRIYPLQLKTIIDKVKTTNKKCIFAFDGKQCLSPDEIRWKNVDTINEASSNIFKLTDKIRTNKEVADFIRQLLNKMKNFRQRDYPNVEISYFCSYKDAKNQLVHLHKFGWKVPNYTPGTTKVYYYEKRYNIPNEHDTPHSVIGQEFDKVVAVIDEFFFYNDDGQLDERYDLWKNGMRKYYSQYGMLYQILTRTRKKLHLVIINNEEILKRCLDILGREYVITKSSS